MVWRINFRCFWQDSLVVAKCKSIYIGWIANIVDLTFLWVYSRTSSYHLKPFSISITPKKSILKLSVADDIHPREMIRKTRFTGFQY
jgi:hypothetical protein